MKLLSRLSNQSERKFAKLSIFHTIKHLIIKMVDIISKASEYQFQATVSFCVKYIQSNG